MFCKKSPERFLFGLIAVAMILTLPVWSGCSKKADTPEDVVLADVGDGHVMSSEYIRRLSHQEMVDLPKDDDGRFLDMTTLEGKQAFLDAIINKELMRQEAEKIGYMKDPTIAEAQKTLTEIYAGQVLLDDIVVQASREISNEEFEAFYAKMGVVRKCHYLITNFIEDAEAAREMALGGADWDDVAAAYHAGDEPPTGEFVIDVPYGQYGRDFETPVFATAVGGVAEPILTVYGYWVLRIDQEVQPRPEKKLDPEKARAKILDTVYARKRAKLQTEFRDELRAKYKLEINEEALWKCYTGLPQDEVIINPETGKPTAQEDLEPLDIKPEDLDLPFYSYIVGDKVNAYSLGDYKAIFDRMTVFQRPKKGEMLGGLRNKIYTEMDKALFNVEARSRGMYEDPRVTSMTNERLEEVLVNKIYQDLVKYDERVTPEQLDAYWAKHKDDFAKPELRSGHLVVCLNGAQAAKARAELEAGAQWKKILVQYGTDRNNKAQAGRMTDIGSNANGPIRDVLFSLAKDELSQPFPLDNGRFGIMSCEQIKPGSPGNLKEDTETVGMVIRRKRENDAFNKLLDQWRADFGVTVYEENLADLPGWDELVNPSASGNVVQGDS